MKQESLGPSLTPLFVARALHQSPAGMDSKRFTSVTTDSRKVAAGSLFVAIQGENVDGHQFIPMAIEKGARGVLCREDKAPACQPELKIFPVEDTLLAFRKLAQAWRREFPIPVIAIAGSVGKTTTKELLAAILQARWPDQVLKTEGSQNGFLGIPITLMNLRARHRAAVIELGIDEPGAMEKHLPIIQPSHSILTAIGPEHLEKLIDIPTVAREEGLALTWTARAKGTVVVNLDDEWIRPYAATIREGKRVVFSMSQRELPANLQGPNAPEGVFGELQGNQLKLREGAAFELPVPGAHNARNLLGAIAMARALGLSDQEIRSGLATFENAGGRSDLKELPGGVRVLCDYYNANPSSVEAALQLLTEISRRKARAARRIACLGDMLELGTGEEKYHRALAEKILALGIEQVCLYGPRMKALAEELKSRGFEGQCRHFGTHHELGEFVLGSLKNGDALLIKGSRGMKMEEVWKIVQCYKAA